MLITYIFIFIASVLAVILSSNWLISSLIKISRFLGWKEFVVAFFTMALAASIPNFFVGISSIFHKIPELSFAEIVGGNIADLTIVVALAALISKGGLSLGSRTVQGSAIFTLIIAILPLLLMFDEVPVLSQIDGLLLIFAFVFYVFWLFNKKERFTKVYNEVEPMGLKAVLKNFVLLIGAVILLLLAAEGIVRSAVFFSETLNFPLALVGILIVGLGNVLPEAFFGIQAARKGEDWMVLGNLMGAVIIPATLVLGLVSLISPIKIPDFSPFVIARFFLIFSAIFFLLFIRTGKKITKKEAIFLLGMYITFVLVKIFAYN